MLWFPYKHLEYLCCRWLLLVAGGVGRGDIYVLIRVRSFDETDGGRKSLLPLWYQQNIRVNG